MRASSTGAQGIDPEHYLRERYSTGGRATAGAYYPLKPLMPRRCSSRCGASTRGAARARSSRAGRSRTCSSGIRRRLPAGDRGERRRTRAVRELLAGRQAVRVRADARRRGPGRHREHRARARGRARARDRLVVELRRRGLPDPGRAVRELRADGCEIGLHGLHHDWKLLRTEERFERTLPAIHNYLDEWGAVGFRSPVTYRNADWMPRLGALYDSSFPDTDPFEPQAGGCCSIFPFFLDDLVELPITLVQDHTMWEILLRAGHRPVGREGALDPREPRARERRLPPGLPDRRGPARHVLPVPRVADLAR